MFQSETEIFIEESHSNVQIGPIFEQQTIEQGIPYLKKGDSSHYIGQFLADETDDIHMIGFKIKEQYKETHLFQIQSQGELSQSYQRNDNTEENWNLSTLHHQASVFHNFQKHLTIALRVIVDLSHINSEKDVIKIAKQLWVIFKQSPVTAKKMLHYILGEKNEHSVNCRLLEKYGFKEIYQNYPEQLINQAKAFLRIQALNQLKEANLKKYTSKRRIKNQQFFILYVKQFMNELSEGFLKKRIKKEKVLKD